MSTRFGNSLLILRSLIFWPLTFPTYILRSSIFKLSIFRNFVLRFPILRLLFPQLLFAEFLVASVLLTGTLINPATCATEYNDIEENSTPPIRVPTRTPIRAYLSSSTAILAHAHTLPRQRTQIYSSPIPDAPIPDLPVVLEADPVTLSSFYPSSLESITFERSRNEPTWVTASFSAPISVTSIPIDRVALSSDRVGATLSTTDIEYAYPILINNVTNLDSSLEIYDCCHRTCSVLVGIVFQAIGYAGQALAIYCAIQSDQSFYMASASAIVDSLLTINPVYWFFQAAGICGSSLVWSGITGVKIPSASVDNNNRVFSNIEHQTWCGNIVVSAICNIIATVYAWNYQSDHNPDNRSINIAATLTAGIFYMISVNITTLLSLYFTGPTHRKFCLKF